MTGSHVQHDCIFQSIFFLLNNGGVDHVDFVAGKFRV